MPGHRAALAWDVKANRELASSEFGICGFAYEGERDPVAPRRFPWRDRHLALAAKGHASVSAVNDSGTRVAQTQEYTVEGYRSRSEYVRKSESRLRPPDFRFYDQAE